MYSVHFNRSEKRNVLIYNFIVWIGFQFILSVFIVKLFWVLGFTVKAYAKFAQSQYRHKVCEKSRKIVWWRECKEINVGGKIKLLKPLLVSKYIYHIWSKLKSLSYINGDFKNIWQKCNLNRKRKIQTEVYAKHSECANICAKLMYNQLNSPLK